jgi:chromosome segregation ATPase
VANPKLAASSAQPDIAELQRRYEQLNTRKIQAGTSLDHAKKELEKLQKEARDTYGTDDLAELRQKLAAMKAENEAKRKSYEADLDRIESELAAVEAKFAAAEAAPPTGKESP